MRALITRSGRTIPLLGTLLLLSSLMLAGCSAASASPTATTPSGPQAQVRMTSSTTNVSGFQFSPDAVTIKVGTTVVWTNSTIAPHTTTSDSGSAVTWDSGLINPGKTFSFTFTQTGTFHYHCSVHPTMVGTITVTA
jgi:plastocyanin